MVHKKEKGYVGGAETWISQEAGGLDGKDLGRLASIR